MKNIKQSRKFLSPFKNETVNASWSIDTYGTDKEYFGSTFYIADGNSSLFFSADKASELRTLENLRDEIDTYLLEAGQYLK